ncbi:hypothetical protein [Roseomonas sp. WA12]
MPAASVTRAVILPSAGFLVWAAHFGALYAVHAHACERDMAARHLLGMPWVAVLVVGATVLSLAVLAVLFRLTWPGTGPRGATEAREAEPDFTRWFGATACVMAGFAVVFEAVPALVLPACR